MSDSEICVSAQNISKKFSRSLKRSFIYGAKDIGKAILGRQGSSELRKSEFWAVRDVSLELRKGGAIGIVGSNGSGKTTLLRMISGIINPTLGDVQINGRIAPMLALGAGFKPVLSGRQNIFLNLSLLGVSEKDTHARFDAIVDFAELHEAIDAPLGTYSSGMKNRLGFSCAVHTKPQILVVDEVLSVGDTKFRAKCRNKINELRREGTSLLLVSHSAILVETLTDECIFMRRGKVAMQGAPRDVLKAYEEDGIKQIANRNNLMSTELSQRQLSDDQSLIVHSVVIKGKDDSDLWKTGRYGEIIVALKSRVEFEDVSVNVMVIDMTHQQGETVLFMMSSKDIGWLRVEKGDVEVALKFPQVGLRSGTYRIKLSVSHGELNDILDTVDDMRLVVRDTGSNANNTFYQPRDWGYTGAEISREPEPIDDMTDLVDDF